MALEQQKGIDKKQQELKIKTELSNELQAFSEQKKIIKS